MKAQGGSRGRASFSLDFFARWRRLANFTLRLLYPRERTSVHIGGEAGWACIVGLDVSGDEEVFCLYRNSNSGLFQRSYAGQNCTGSNEKCARWRYRQICVSCVIYFQDLLLKCIYCRVGSCTTAPPTPPPSK
jgi:hypothetical protein